MQIQQIQLELISVDIMATDTSRVLANILLLSYCIAGNAIFVSLVDGARVGRPASDFKSGECTENEIFTEDREYYCRFYEYWLVGMPWSSHLTIPYEAQPGTMYRFEQCKCKRGYCRVRNTEWLKRTRRSDEGCIKREPRRCKSAQEYWNSSIECEEINLEDSHYKLPIYLTTPEPRVLTPSVNGQDAQPIEDYEDQSMEM